MESAMKKVRVEKVTLNIGCGTRTNIEHARKILEMFSSRKAVVTKTRKRTTFNVPKNKPIGCKVTIRDDVEKILRLLLEARENRLPKNSFDSTGNFSFGVKEYIDIPGMDYDPKIGILGMDVCVTLERPGYRVKRRRLGGKVGKKHLISTQEAIDFVKQNFGVAVE